MNTMATFCCSPIPSHSMVNGIQVMEGNGRRMETNGSIIAFAGAHTPITMPNGTATSAASANPANTRCEDIHTSIANCPLAITVTASFHTAAGEGKNTGAIQPRPVATLHNANTLATDARLISNNQGERGDKLRS